MKSMIEDGVKSIASLIHTAVEFAENNSPAIASAMAIGGFVAAAVLAAVKTPKAVEEFKEAGIETFEDVKENPKETTVIFLKNYWQPVGLVTTSIGLEIFSNVEYNKKLTTFAALCQASTETCEALRSTLRETLGDRKAKEIEEEAVGRVSDGNPSDGRVVIQANGGKTRFYDIMTNTWFYSDIDTINNVLRDLDCKILMSDSFDDDDGWIDANEGWREALGLDDIAGYNQFGWSRKILNAMSDDTKPISSLFIFGSKLDEDMNTSITIYYPMYDKRTGKLITRRN